MIAGGGIYSFFLFCLLVDQSERHVVVVWGQDISILQSFLLSLVSTELTAPLSSVRSHSRGFVIQFAYRFILGTLSDHCAIICVFSVVVGLLEFRKRAPVIKHALISNQ